MISTLSLALSRSHDSRLYFRPSHESSFHLSVSATRTENEPHLPRVRSMLVCVFLWS